MESKASSQDWDMVAPSSNLEDLFFVIAYPHECSAIVVPCWVSDEIGIVWKIIHFTLSKI